MWGKTWNLLYPPVLLCLASLAGPARAQYKACEHGHQCEKDQFCQRGFCAPGCWKTAQCTPGLFCIDHRCMKCKPGATRSCYDGRSELRGVGVCRAGTQYCNASGTGWSACWGQRLEQDEICDRKDNDCDGKVDEGITCECTPGGKRKCYSGPPGTEKVGLCKAGFQYCQEDHRWGPCLGQRLPAAEICDGLDNDCNGTIDKGIACQCKAGGLRSCYSHAPKTANVGQCRRGVQLCRANHTWAPRCYGQRGPSKELCDGKDNDCDGVVDEGCLGRGTIGRPRPAGVGSTTARHRVARRFSATRGKERRRTGGRIKAGLMGAAARRVQVGLRRRREERRRPASRENPDLERRVRGLERRVGGVERDMSEMKEEVRRLREERR